MWFPSFSFLKYLINTTYPSSCLLHIYFMHKPVPPLLKRLIFNHKVDLLYIVFLINQLLNSVGKVAYPPADNVSTVIFR